MAQIWIPFPLPKRQANFEWQLPKGSFPKSSINIHPLNIPRVEHSNQRLQFTNDIIYLANPPLGGPWLKTTSTTMDSSADPEN